MTKTHVLILSSFAFLLSACGPAKKPDFSEDEKSGIAEPLLTDSSERKFSQLPLEGKARGKRRFWSGDYWPLNKGLINYRWYSGEQGFNLVSPDRTEALGMSRAAIMALSPAEKFDLLRGRYDYPLRNEVSWKASPNAEYWEGICHGWAPAALNHSEPDPKDLRNPDGIIIPFGSTDIKALISYYYAHVYVAPTNFQVGRRCPESRSLFNWNRDCRNDLKAHSFHIILANNLGLKGKSFIADIKRYDEVWNHPYLDYKSEITDRRKPWGIFSRDEVKEIISIRTVMTYLNESETNTWEPVLGTSLQETGTKTYEYELDLDEGGVIIGGRWKSKERPDFLWTMSKPQSFEKNLEGLAGLLND